MIFNTGAALLDAIVLAVVSKEKEGTYGYKITQDVRSVLSVSESTLYPVLRRLQKEGYFELYDKAIDGRNRRYYKITDTGRSQLNMYVTEWGNYSKKITDLFENESSNLDLFFIKLSAFYGNVRKNVIRCFF
jgi:PadR family transcriptional regulator PadR